MAKERGVPRDLVLKPLVIVLSIVCSVFLGAIFFTSSLFSNKPGQRYVDEPEPQLVVNTPEPTSVFVPSPTIVLTATPVIADNNNFSKDYDFPPVKQTKGTVRIPVLTYHHIAALPKESRNKPYYVTASTLEQQMEYLKQKNYRVVTPTEFYALVKKGSNPTQKTVMITFDDGGYDNYQNAFPILKKYAFPGVFYINSKKLAISSVKLQEMVKAGMVIDSHTASHIDLRAENRQDVLNSEIIGSKSAIEHLTKKTVVSVSYPGCTFDDQVVKTAVAAGYKFGVTCGKSIDHNPRNMFSISRMHVYNDFNHFKKLLSGYWGQP